MVKKEIYKGLGLDTDTAPNDRKTDVYWDAENIQIINNGRSLSIRPIQGETLVNVTLVNLIPQLPHYIVDDEFSDRKVVGTCSYKDNLYFFTHTEAYIDIPTNCTYKIDELYKLDSTHVLTRLAYAQGRSIEGLHWNFTYSTKLDCLINYENDNLIKLYWVDGVNQLRYINVAVTTGLVLSGINAVEVVTLATPTVELLVDKGGSLTAGTIQYVYNFYNVNGAQTALSPASTLTSLARTFYGFSSGQNTGLGCRITIPVDQTGSYPNYNIIRIYSIHYLELDQTPLIKLVTELPITASATSVVYNDYGSTFVAEYTVEDLLGITNFPIIPNTLATKRDRLFIGNYSYNEFNPIIDVRVYSYPAGTTPSTVIDGVARTKAQLDAYSATANCINSDPLPGGQKYKYNSSATLVNLGATGYNFELGYSAHVLPTSSEEPITVTPPKSLKKRENYRIGIVLYNKYGQRSPAKWMTDICVPDISNSNEVVTGLTVKIVDSNAVARLEAAGVTGYQLCIVERRPEDRTIISQGFIVPGCLYTINGTGTHYSNYIYPYYTVKEIASLLPYLADPYMAAGIHYDRSTNDWSYAAYPEPYPKRVKDVAFFYSSDTMFETDLPMPTHVRILGEAVGTPNDGMTTLSYYTDNTISFGNTISNSKVVWGPQLDPNMPEHINVQSSTPAGTASILNYNVIRQLVYTDIYRNGDSSWEIEPLHTLQTGAMWLNKGDIRVLNPNQTVRSATDFTGIINTDTGKLAISLFGQYDNSIVLSFPDSNWHTSGSNDYDRFDLFDIIGTLSDPDGKPYRGLPLVELVRELPDQYGGNTYTDKSLNEYLPLGALHSINTSTYTDYIGDVWAGPLNLNRLDGLDYKGQGQMSHYEYVYVHFMENNHNVYARKDFMQRNKYYLSGDNYRFNRISDNHNLFSAYNQVPKVFKQYPIPFNYTTVNNYPTTVLGSNVKIPNELLDNWLVFPPTNIKHLEGQYGTLTKLHNLAGEILAVQSSGIALLEIEPRVQTVDTNNIGIQLGIGDLFYNHKYLVTNSGTNRKFTVVDDGKEMYYYDDNLNIIASLQQGKVSTLKTVKNILDTYPAGPFSAVFNNNKSQLYFQYTGFSLVYDLLLGKFISKHTFLNSNKWLVPVFDTLYQLDDSGTDVVINTQLTGSYKTSKLVYLLCPESTYEKVFHTLEYRLKGNDFTTMRVYNDRSTTATLAPDVKNKFDIHRIHLPRVENSRERFRGIYIFVELNNTSEFSLDDLVLMYNIKG